MAGVSCCLVVLIQETGVYKCASLDNCASGVQMRFVKGVACFVRGAVCFLGGAAFFLGGAMCFVWGVVSRTGCVPARFCTHIDTHYRTRTHAIWTHWDLNPGPSACNRM